MEKRIIEGNCSTLIAGKYASTTGHVLVAHGEDTSGVRSQTHLVPRKNHEQGEVVTFDDGTAVIPQVLVTNAYLWNEVRVPGGESFADTFLNEHGVAVFSNNGLGSKIAKDGSTGGIGYGFRKLISERATSARHGVEIAIELIEEFGYRSSRIYHIVDKDEAWSVQLTTGHQLAAQRVGDDEVYYLPNWYTIHQIDFNDTEHKNFYWSKDLVNFAIEQGWYTPAKEGDYSDFDFAKVYQDENGPSHTMINFDRSEIGWKALTGGKEVPDKTFAIKAEKKYSIEDFKHILRIRYLDIHPEAVDQVYEPTDGVDVNKHYGINWHGSIEGSAIEFNDDPNLNCMWKTIDRQRHSIFMPIYYGINEVPDGFEYIGEQASTASHFHVDRQEIEKFDKNSAFWAFHLLRDLMDFEYEEDKLIEKVKELENYFTLTKAQTDSAYLNLKQTSMDYAKEYLTDYTNAMCQKAVKFVWDMIMEIAHDKFIEKETRNF